MEGDGEDCDREICNIVNHADFDEDEDDEEVGDEIEPEIEVAAQLTEEDLTKQTSELMCHLKITQEDDFSGKTRSKKISSASCPGGATKSGSSGSSESGSESHKSLGGSPLAHQRNTSRCTNDQYKLRLGEFSSRSSRKGSSCSTPVSCCRNDVDYPSPNFIRDNVNNNGEVVKSESIDESNRLSIRLHYNPVMDEWVSLTDESSIPSIQDADILFDLHKSEPSGKNDDLDDDEVISVAHFLTSLEKSGIRRTDPRLKEMMKNLEDIRREAKLTAIGSYAVDYLMLDRKTFKTAIDPCLTLLSRAFKCQFVLPEFGNFCQGIEKIYEHCKENDNGEVASYIPQLARYSREYWGVSVCTVDGQRFSLGDVNIPFTMQSCSKPFTYAVCLNELGAETVHGYVGQEPSGRMFNEMALDYNNKPHNPLLNSGAIMSASLLLNLVHPEMNMSQKFDFVEQYLQRLAGGEFFSFNNSVFLSEKDTADRNYALAYYMKENKCFPKGFVLQDCLDFYFQTCSMEVNCETLAVMGATLANGGECPITNEPVISPSNVRDVLSLMHSCGMYNYSGQFAFNVGLPAKSGVSGALVLVVPNVMGIGLWSPPLDQLGNTCRGVQFSTELVKLFNFHRFDNLVTKGNEKLDPRRFQDEKTRQQVLCVLYSATTGDLTALKRFQSSNVKMGAPNYDGRTALHLAASEGHLSCVQFLVETCNLNPLAEDRWGYTPLSEAKRFNHEITFRYLVKHLEDTRPQDLAEYLEKKQQQE